MKLSEFTGEKALDVLADIIEPLSRIFGDEEVRKLANEDTIAKGLSLALKRYKKDVLTVMAVLDDKDPKKYKPTLVEIPTKLMDMMKDEDFRKLFMSQGQETESESFGSATENTKATEKE